MPDVLMACQEFQEIARARKGLRLAPVNMQEVTDTVLRAVKQAGVRAIISEGVPSFPTVLLGIKTARREHPLEHHLPLITAAHPRTFDKH